MLAWLKLIPGILIGVALATVPACKYGQSIERDAAAIEEGKRAIERVGQLERNNADFKKLSPRDRCLVFMRDSGLPEQSCD
ncbi:hypothetical protein M0654_14110 [Rhizobium sp. NTR19]|uniref:Lipoprotein n=1 Tax=Neorhizobium turbinariae TaxID=2937795 RepID=A0ABT0ITC1_9HYPH|nr:hypothetical protein [Neorhizobium turbinariae]MCK8781117.1 hypothetical protein [Neorhizobium turbinariae]